MQPLFSVVMPVYNAAAYLQKAVQSVVDQTERDWELILVDDASTDGSGELCEAAARADSRIRVVHFPENRGLSHARNEGMRAACGRYLMFMDSDDWVERELLAGLRAALESGDAPQMIVWGVTEEHFDERGRLLRTGRMTCAAESCRTTEQTRRCALRLEQATLLGYAWNKLYDRALIQSLGVEFEQIPLIEDIWFNLEVLRALERMQVLEIAPYHYARRVAGSLTNRYLPYYYEQNMKRLERMLALYAGWGMEEAAVCALAPTYVRYALSALQRNCDPRAGMSRAERRKFAGELLESGLFWTFRPYMDCTSGLNGAIARILVGRNVNACLLAGRGVYFVKTQMRGLFVQLSGTRKGAGK